MKKHELALVVAAATTVFAGAPEVLAIEEVVVTANKREQSLSDVGLAVSAIGGEAIKLRRVADGEDLAMETPGLNFTPSPSATPVYTLRGVGFFESSLAAYPDVSLYVDQAPLPFPAMASKVVFDLERAEVLKGPQGTLFGNNATGGAINYIAAKPTDEFEAGFDLTYGRFDTKEVEGYVSGPLSDDLRGRLAFKTVKSDGWQSSYQNSDELGDQDNQAARLILEWDASEDLTFSLNINGWKDEDETQAPQHIATNLQFPVGTPGVFGPGVTPASPIANIPNFELNSRDAGWTPGIPFRDNDFWQTTLRADYRINDNLTLTSITNYAELDYLNGTESDGTDLLVLDIARDAGDIETFSQEFRLANDPANKFRWVLGANIEKSEVDQSTIVRYSATTSQLVLGISSNEYESFQEMDNLAFFANMEFDVADFMTLKAGIRQTSAERDAVASNHDDPIYPAVNLTTSEFFSLNWPGIPGYAGSNPIAPDESFILDLATLTNGEPKNNLDEDSTSWSVGVDFRVTDDLLLYFNVMQGYKAGSSPHLSGSLFVAYQPVTEESLLDYEVGFKGNFMDGRLQVNGGAFYYDYEDKQLRAKFVDRTFGALDQLTNVPESEVYGAELEVVAALFEGFQLSAAVTYLDAEVTEYEGVIGAEVVGGVNVAITDDFDGVPLPYAPQWSFNVRGDYIFAISDTLEGIVGVSVLGQSETTSKLTTVAAEKDIFEIRDYVVVNANLGIASTDGQWKVMLWGKNITDEYYWTNTIQTFDNTVRYAARPAEYGITFSMNF